MRCCIAHGFSQLSGILSFNTIEEAAQIALKAKTETFTTKLWSDSLDQLVELFIPFESCNSPRPWLGQ